jgi:hypothetical protein
MDPSALAIEFLQLLVEAVTHDLFTGGRSAHSRGFADRVGTAAAVVGKRQLLLDLLR